METRKSSVKPLKNPSNIGSVYWKKIYNGFLLKPSPKQGEFSSSDLFSNGCIAFAAGSAVDLGFYAHQSALPRARARARATTSAAASSIPTSTSTCTRRGLTSMIQSIRPRLHIAVPRSPPAICMAYFLGSYSVMSDLYCDLVYYFRGHKRYVIDDIAISGITAAIVWPYPGIYVLALISQQEQP